MGAEMTGFRATTATERRTAILATAATATARKSLLEGRPRIVIDVPRDRKSEFAPAIVKKRQKDIGGFEGTHPFPMYAKGMSTRDIQHHVKEIYNHDISPGDKPGCITDVDKAKEWQNRGPLEPIYAIVFSVDALFLKLRVDGRVKNVVAYLMVAASTWRGKRSVW